jgi:hypothetical protein
MPHRLSISVSAGIATLLCVTLGCSSRDATVSGRVTCDGKVCDHGNVTFHPVGDGAVAYGTIGSSGEYSVRTGQGKGLAVGEYTVTVQVVSVIDPGATKTDEHGALAEDAGRLLSPPRYATPQTSPLKVKVAAGTNHLDLELKSS